MFTLKFLKDSLIKSVNINRNCLVVSSRSLQLFKKPNDSKKDDEEEEEDAVKIAFNDELDDTENSEWKQMQIDQMRNKSRLRTQHRNALNGNVPYDREESWIHQTLKYKRIIYGRYGAASGIDPSKHKNVFLCDF